jgi:hypothetical protein
MVLLEDRELLVKVTQEVLVMEILMLMEAEAEAERVLLEVTVVQLLAAMAEQELHQA